MDMILNKITQHGIFFVTDRCIKRDRIFRCFQGNMHFFNVSSQLIGRVKIGCK